MRYLGMADTLAELERRVTEKWARAFAARQPDWFPPELSDWSDTSLPGDVPVMQFPRERWASYPAKRTVTLMMCEQLLDQPELSDEAWATVCAAMQYGGKTRIA